DLKRLSLQVAYVQDVQKDPHSGVSLEPRDKAQTGSDTFVDLTHFKCVFCGPPDTPYHGATYSVDIKIPNDYPLQPLVMKFNTKIQLLNISNSIICRDTLDSIWLKGLDIEPALISLQLLLFFAESLDLQDA
ncbi:hypothetical protein D6C92_05896, partial [Aureobasidium pullulans]